MKVNIVLYVKIYTDEFVQIQVVVILDIYLQVWHAHYLGIIWNTEIIVHARNHYILGSFFKILYTCGIPVYESTYFCHFLTGSSENATYYLFRIRRFKSNQQLIVFNSARRHSRILVSSIPQSSQPLRASLVLNCHPKSNRLTNRHFCVQLG